MLLFQIQIQFWSSNSDSKSNIRTRQSIYQHKSMTYNCKGKQIYKCIDMHLSILYPCPIGQSLILRHKLLLLQ